MFIDKVVANQGEVNAKLEGANDHRPRGISVPSRRRRIGRAIGAVIASIGLVLTTLAAPTTASADPWPTSDRNGVQLHPDSWYHWYCMWSSGDWAIPANMQDNAEAVTVDALGARTEATVRRDATCDTVADDGRTDAVFEEHDLDQNVL